MRRKPIWRRPVLIVARNPSRSSRAARRARAGNSTVATATENIPCGSMYNLKAAFIAAGARSGSISREANSVSITALTLISPSVRVTGSINAKIRRTAGSRQSSDQLEATVEPSEPRHGEQQLDQGADEDGARVDVQLRVLAADPRHPQREPRDDRQVPEHGVSAGTVKWS